MNHKRRRPKSRRAGCLMCKPHKIQHQRSQASIHSGRSRRLAERAKDAEET